VCVILVNLGGEPFVIRRGDRIAQLVLAPVERAAYTEAPELPVTGRGAGGFGSTGA
jgi:dUTP pyrophosphatase